MRQPVAPIVAPSATPMFPLTIAQGGASLDTSPPPAGAVASPSTTGEGQPLPPGAAAGEGAPPAPGLGGLLLPMALMIGVIMLFSLGSGRKEKKRRMEMLSQLAKGAAVQTLGGVKGTVMEVRESADEVVVKVDEKSNTSMRFARSAIVNVTPTDG